MPALPDFGQLVWGLAFALALRASSDVGHAWASADEAWQRHRDRMNHPSKAPGRPAPKVKRRKK